MQGRWLRQTFFVLLLLLLASSTSTWAEEKEWHWVRVAPGLGQGWDVLQGTADVTFKGNEFATTLRNGADNDYREFAISGTIKGDEVVASEVRLETDANAQEYHGTIREERTSKSDASQGWGSDRIFLNSGPYFIGLYIECQDDCYPY